jgi:hypothetical protein
MRLPVCLPQGVLIISNGMQSNLVAGKSNPSRPHKLILLTINFERGIQARLFIHHLQK